MALSPVELYTGDNWVRFWRGLDAAQQPVDITGSSAKLQVRDEAGDVVFEASSAAGTLTINGPAGAVTLNRPHGLAVGVYSFDLRLTLANGTPVRLEPPNTLTVMQGVTV